MQTLTDQNNTLNNKHRLSFIYKFFCWCSGARLYILKECPSDYNKYFGIGVVVFLTGLMASLSGGYAMYTVFQDVNISIGFGLLWGFVIFSIDWYIVASLRKHQNRFKELFIAFPRLVLAVLIAFVVSMPLKMKLFEREIEQQILFDQQESILNYQQLVSEEFNEIEKLQEENVRLSDEIKRKEEQRNKLFSMIIEEAEGLSPTKAIGKGPVYREKKLEYDKVDEELRSIRSLNHRIIDLNNEQIQLLKDKREQVISSAQIANRESDGFLARLQALNSLTSGNIRIQWASWFIILLFITIESAPIFVKLLSARGPYDDMIEAEEYIKQVEIRKRVVQAELTEDHQIDLHRLLEKERNEKLYEVEKNHIQTEALVLSEINKLKIQKWKEEELSKLNEQKPKDGNDLDNDDFSKSEKIFEPEESPEIKDIPTNLNDDDEMNDNLSPIENIKGREDNNRKIE